MLTSERASTVLRGLETNQLVAEAEEIDEILSFRLAVEADPDDLGLLQWLTPCVREITRRDLDHPGVEQLLRGALASIEKDLASDWYRMTTGRSEIARREADRVAIKRALGLLRDRQLVHALVRLTAEAREIAPGAEWVVCHQLGVERYAITHKGRRVRRAIAARLDRVRAVPLKTFLYGFEKAETKMRAFQSEITTLARNIGYVKKNREQVVIGLAKAGVPAGHALGAYHAALPRVQTPDAAVTCVRNAAMFGGPDYAAMRLRQAQAALQRAGIPNIPIAMSAAKALVAINPPEAGVPRFIELLRRLEPVLGRSETNYKHAARLMPAAGTPDELLRRVSTAVGLLGQNPSRVTPRTNDVRPIAVALASMVRATESLPDLVARYRAVEHRLAVDGVSTPHTVEADALECVACPGTPAEVVDTVSALIERLAEGRDPHRGDVAIAVAFAKRFAY